MMRKNKCCLQLKVDLVRDSGGTWRIIDIGDGSACGLAGFSSADVAKLDSAYAEAAIRLGFQLRPVLPGVVPAKVGVPADVISSSFAELEQAYGLGEFLPLRSQIMPRLSMWQRLTIGAKHNHAQGSPWPAVAEEHKWLLYAARQRQESNCCTFWQSDEQIDKGLLDSINALNNGNGWLIKQGISAGGGKGIFYASTMKVLQAQLKDIQSRTGDTPRSLWIIEGYHLKPKEGRSTMCRALFCLTRDASGYLDIQGLTAKIFAAHSTWKAETAKAVLNTKNAEMSNIEGEELDVVKEDLSKQQILWNWLIDLSVEKIREQMKDLNWKLPGSNQLQRILDLNQQGAMDSHDLYYLAALSMLYSGRIGWGLHMSAPTGRTPELSLPHDLDLSTLSTDESQEEKIALRLESLTLTRALLGVLYQAKSSKNKGLSGFAASSNRMFNIINAHSRQIEASCRECLGLYLENDYPSMQPKVALVLACKQGDYTTLRVLLLGGFAKIDELYERKSLFYYALQAENGEQKARCLRDLVLEFERISVPVSSLCLQVVEDIKGCIEGQDSIELLKAILSSHLHKHLMDKKYDTADNNRALRQAVFSGDVFAVALLLYCKNADPDDLSRSGMSAKTIKAKTVAKKSVQATQKCKDWIDRYQSMAKSPRQRSGVGGEAVKANGQTTTAQGKDAGTQHSKGVTTAVKAADGAPLAITNNHSEEGSSIVRLFGPKAQYGELAMVESERKETAVGWKK